jgi:hypothetical protein
MTRILKTGPDRFCPVCLTEDSILTMVCMPIILDNSRSPIWERNKIVWTQCNGVQFISMSWFFCGSLPPSHNGENIMYNLQFSVHTPRPSWYLPVFYLFWLQSDCIFVWKETGTQVQSSLNTKSVEAMSVNTWLPVWI